LGDARRAVILAATVAVIVAVVLVGGVAWLLVQDAKADDRVSTAWRDEQARERSRDDG
jgi:uncharacterized membrane protein